MTNNIKKYPAIIAYCQSMGSYQYWVNDQMEKARAMDAADDCYAVDESTTGNGNIQKLLRDLRPDCMTAMYFFQNHRDLYDLYIAKVSA